MKKNLIAILISILILSSINFIAFQSSSDYSDHINLNPNEYNSLFKNEDRTNVIETINQMDGHFTENRGQIDNESVKYYIQGKGVWFLEDGIVFEIHEPVERQYSSNLYIDKYSPEFLNGLEKAVKQKRAVLKLNFEGSNKVMPRGEGLLTHRNNYFYGNDSSKWCTDVPNYQEVVYEDIYDNIDLKYYSNEKGLKYDFIVRPGGNPSEIILSYEGAQDLQIDAQDSLIINTPIRPVVDTELIIYQHSTDNKNKIDGAFKKIDAKTYGFEIFGEFDKNKDLIIDPLIYSTFIGGSSHDRSYGVEVDSGGDAYFTGYTNSVNFPTTLGAYETSHNGDYDVFVLKLNSNGSSLLYSTYIGGHSDDSGTDVKINSNGYAFITGYTRSMDFPYTPGANDTTHNGGYDVFILKLNPTGSSLIYSTFIGGSNWDFGSDIEIDNIGNAFVTGCTNSSNFPTTPGANDTTHGGWEQDDAFVLKLNQVGTVIIYSTFIGGTGWDAGNNIEIDSNGNVYLTGQTESTDFPTTPGAYNTTYYGWNWETFVLKLDSMGSSLIYSTLVGRSEDMGEYGIGRGIAIDSIGNAYITGNTASTKFPTTSSAFDTTYNGGLSDVFVFKLNSMGSELLYSTFVGGTEGDHGCDIEVDSSGNVYVTGLTESINFPYTPGAYDISHNGGYDMFILRLNPNGSSLTYSSFFGGIGDDAGYNIDIDSYGDVYTTGGTDYFDFPTTPDAYDPEFNSIWPEGDGFGLKLNLHIPPSVLDLKISNSKVLRTDVVYLYSNATDIEDSEQKLIPIFEYRAPSEQVWNSTYFSKPEYNNSRWEVSFTPPKNASLGAYDFRVKFIDTSNLNSNWLYLNDSLTVLNNIPTAENLLLSKSEALRGENIIIDVNGADMEDNEENLIIELKYKRQDEKSWDIIYLQTPEYKKEHWECKFSISYNATIDYYDFKARFQDKDGDYSPWLYKNSSLLVKNNPIIINVPDNDIIMHEDTNKIINLTDWFQDPEGEKLVFKIEGQNNISITQFENGTIILEPKLNWNGIEDLIISANDTIGEVSNEVQFKVLPVNDPPEKPIIYEPEDGDEFNVTHQISFIGYCDDVDLIYGDELNFTWTSNISGVIGFGNELYNLTLPAGYHNITLIATDLDNLFNTMSIYINIYNLTFEDLLEIDSDNDTYNDTYEKLKGTNPFDNTSYPLDTDGDGIFDYLDPDDDNDGYSDSMERAFSTDPLDPNDIPPDLDNDLLPDLIDPDIDGDGVPNEDDEYPNDPEKWEKHEIDYTIILSTIIGVFLLILLLMILFFTVKKKKIKKNNDKKSN